MGVVRFHGKALRLNGFTDGLVVPTGKYRESGIDLRPNEFAATIKSTKSHATKIGRMHIDSISNPLNAIRGSFTIDAYIVPDYGGVIIEKPGSFRLKYGEPFSNGKLLFEVYTADRPYTLSTTFSAPTYTSNNSGVYSSSTNAHRPQDLTFGKQGLVLVTAQYTQKEIRCFINGDLVAELNLGGEGGVLEQSSSDIFIGGRGGEFRGAIESIRIAQGEIDPKIEPLSKTQNTFGLWTFDDEYDVPQVYFFDNARPGAAHQGRDGPDRHNGLLDIPMVAIGHTFNTTHFKIRDYSANPGGPTDRYSALEKLAALTQGIPLEEVRDQTWYSSTLDLTDQAYFTGVSSTVLNAVINQSGTSPITGTITPPDSQNVRFGDNTVLATSSTSTLNPSINRIERIRITGIDFANSRLNCTSVHLANDAANGTVDNFPETQGHLFAHTDNTPVYFTIGRADLLIDPGNTETSGSVTGQRKRKRDTFTLAQYTQGQRFTDTSGFSNDAFFFSTKSRSTTSTDADTLYEPSDTYSGMGAVTAYNLIEGNFYLKMLPSPDEQSVKQTIQGIANTFHYENDDVSIHSLVQENQKIRVTEPVYHGEIARVINKSTTVGATDSGSSSSNVFNRIVVESGVGFYDSSISQNLYASTRDEIVAIAVSNVKPFMLKGLDIDHTADISGGVPTNDSYIRHLTPERKSRIAVIDSNSTMTAGGVPNQILVHYNAIDLTGEIIAGTSLATNGVSSKFQLDHATGNAAYLVVSKTVPCGSAVFGGRTLSDWLRRPYSGNQTDASAIALTITAPGGLVSLPTATFNDRPASHTLTSNPTGDITPSPFINIEDTVYGVGTGIRGYSTPKAIASTNTPDDTSNADFHLMYISNKGGINQTSHADTQNTPSSFRRSNLSFLDVIDNELTGNANFVLAHPSNRDNYGMLDDVSHTSNSPLDIGVATIEKNLMRGRIEEITPQMGDEGESKVTIRGRSLLMDVIDHRSSRDFNLGQGSPVKEIGDLGTPTVTMTLGGLGQGGIDIQPTYAEHPFLPGWKDKIVGSGNASVRNDKQTSTYYASTRALTELPLFPSMFYDVDSLISSDNDARSPIESSKSFKMSIDCTMAINRPEMRENESRFAVDWGQHSPVSSLHVSDQLYDWLMTRVLIRCQRPSVQAVVTSYSSGTLNVDDASAFLKTNGERGLAANCADDFYVTIGEGVLNDGYGITARAAYTNGTSLTITTSETWNPTNTAANESSNLGNIDAGMTVTLGGFIVVDGATTVANDTSPIILSLADISGITQGDTPLGESDRELIAEALADTVKAIIGLNADAVHVDPNNSNRYLILDGPNMEAFEWDPEETHEAANDRQLQHPVVCRTSHYGLKGKKSDGTSLDYVRPLDIDFYDIANKTSDFNVCVEEIIRQINMAGHPQAKNSSGGSAFNPPAIFPLVSSNADTGTHMGYVRAFIGSETESRDGERGSTIVIHSTVPGASGRNFNVGLSNRTPYSYKPAQVVGYGGPIATNSRMYQPNSFPAPMPIGADGESFVPISTFRGAPSGSTLDTSNAVRTYNGLGGSFKVTTVASPTCESLVGAAVSGVTMTNPTLAAYDPASDTDLNHLAVSTTASDYIKRIAKTTGPLQKGILRVGRMVADFEGIDQQRVILSSDVMTNCFLIRNIVPRDNLTDFIGLFYDSDDGAIEGVEVELLYPGVEQEGIIYFGGGHTGVTFDISDGTANDYSDDFLHHYSKGPTGFSGFQNLHEISTASAVLDFTNITNNDTINENTLQGIHHRIKEESGLIKRCILYARLNEAVAYTNTSFNQGQDLSEAIYNSKLRVSRGSAATTVATTYSSGSTLYITDATDFETSGTNNAIAGSDFFQYTGRDISGSPHSLTGVSGLAAVNSGIEVAAVKATDHATMDLQNGPAYSVDATSKGLDFHGLQTVATHYWTGSAVNKEYGPMADFDCTGDYSISVWFKPNFGSNFDNKNIQAASGPLITGRDTNGRYWGLYLAGQNSLTGDGTGNDYQQACFHFIFHDGTNQRSVSNVADSNGVRLRRGNWHNLIMSKTGATVTFRLSGADFYTGNTQRTNTTHTFTSSSVHTLTGGTGSVGQGHLPKNIGETTQTGMCFIGLSSIQSLDTTPVSTNGPMDCYTINGSAYGMACGTTDGANAYLESSASTEKIWAWNMTMGEIGVFDYTFSLTEAQEMFAARAVW